MTPLASTEDIRRWCKRNVGRGKPVPTRPMLLALNHIKEDYKRFKQERCGLSKRLRRAYGKFIADWEHGLVEFRRVKTGRPGTVPQKLFRCEVPKPRPPTLQLDWQRGTLKFLPKPILPLRMPVITNLFDRLDSDKR